MSILYEDRSILATDKPRGWILAPEGWGNSQRNLFEALLEGIRRREFWAASRNMKFIRFLHRLDGETSGVMLWAKHANAVSAYQRMFEERRMHKVYLAVVDGEVSWKEWHCELGIQPHPMIQGKFQVGQVEKGDRRRESLAEEDEGGGAKAAETFFRRLRVEGGMSLVAAFPVTGRTHQIRVHLKEAGYPIRGDRMYGRFTGKEEDSLFGLRSVSIQYLDPFTRKPVRIRATTEKFLRRHGFDPKLDWKELEP